MLRSPIVSWASNLGLVIATVAAVSCDAQNSNNSSSCSTGAERCACYPNHSCNEGLACLSNICVALDNAAAGGWNVPANGGATFGDTTGLAEGGVPASTTFVATGGTDVQTGSAGNAEGGTSAVASGGATTNGNTTNPTTVVAKGGAVATGGAVTTGGSSTVSSGGTVATSSAVLVGKGGAVATGGSSTTPVGSGGTTATGGQAATAGTTSTAGPNLIKDGTFQAFDTYWNAILQEGDSGTYTRPPTASAVCVTNTSTSSSLYYELSFTVGYPNYPSDTFVIEPGATYTLSYTVNATYPLLFEVKIGHSVSPWTEVYLVTNDVLSSSYKTFTHQFTSAAGDTSAGLAFNAVLDLYGKLCLQQVSLTKN